MKKVELNLIALTNSESHQGQFALVLEDTEMKRRIPITIGAFEAQAIAMVVEKMKPVRPQTHDLFYNSIKALEVSVVEVIINEIVDDRYHSKIVFKKGNEKIEVDSRTSDAIALAVRCSCPIYTYDHILKNAGFTVDTEGLPVDKRGSFINFPLNELEDLLEKVLKKEDYESATRIRDAINKKKR
ncbi:bifunctional nuclease domain-containing protein [Ekhidna sp.]|uniref:bifunctional nuclease family protein n=1 Tax=Ekhidna sp. TaxID=2608089 RepID=UPI003299155F